MYRVRHTLLAIVGLLLSTAAIADDAEVNSPDVTLASVVALYFQTLNSDALYDARRHSPYRQDLLADTNIAAQPIAKFDFQDSRAFARVGRIRAVSLLTLIEMKSTRLFFGINRRGLVGIHLRAASPYNDERYLEVARMPYLADTPPSSLPD